MGIAEDRDMKRLPELLLHWNAFEKEIRVMDSWAETDADRVLIYREAINAVTGRGTFSGLTRSALSDRVWNHMQDAILSLKQDAGGE